MSQIPRENLGGVEDPAKIIVYLCSEAAKDHGGCHFGVKSLSVPRGPAAAARVLGEDTKCPAPEGGGGICPYLVSVRRNLPAAARIFFGGFGSDI